MEQIESRVGKKLADIFGYCAGLFRTSDLPRGGHEKNTKCPRACIVMLLNRLLVELSHIEDLSIRENEKNTKKV